MTHPFATGIDELGTFPDRVKFEALGMVAEDAIGNRANVQVLCNILYTKLASVDGSRKLPILYLLDYISKQLGQQFQEGFAGQLVPAFVQAYNVAPPHDQEKLKGLLQTWNDQGLYSNQLAEIYGQILAAAPGAYYDHGAAPPAKRARMETGVPGYQYGQAQGDQQYWQQQQAQQSGYQTGYGYGYGGAAPPTVPQYPQMTAPAVGAYPGQSAGTAAGGYAAGAGGYPMQGYPQQQAYAQPPMAAAQPVGYTGYGYPQQAQVGAYPGQGYPQYPTQQGMVQQQMPQQQMAPQGYPGYPQQQVVQAPMAPQQYPQYPQQVAATPQYPSRPMYPQQQQQQVQVQGMGVYPPQAPMQGAMAPQGYTQGPAVVSQGYPQAAYPSVPQGGYDPSSAGAAVSTGMGGYPGVQQGVVPPIGPYAGPLQQQQGNRLSPAAFQPVQSVPGRITPSLPGQPATGSTLGHLVSRLAQNRPASSTGSDAGSATASSTVASAAGGVARGGTPLLGMDNSEISAATLSVRDDAFLSVMSERFKHRCTLCAIRFERPEELTAHVREAHPVGKDKDKDAAGKPKSRPWHMREEQWLGCKPRDSEGEALGVFELLAKQQAEALAAAAEAGADGEGADGGLDASYLLGSGAGAGAHGGTGAGGQVRKRVFVDDAPDAKCAACGEPFSKRFDDDSDKWMYVGAVGVPVTLPSVDGSAGGEPHTGLKVYHVGCRPATVSASGHA